MKRILQTLLIVMLVLGVAGSSLAGSYTTHGYFYKPAYGEKGASAYALYNAALDALDATLYTVISGLAPQEDYVLFISATPTYVDNNTFTVPGDYTSRFAAGKIVQAQVAAGMVYSTVASSSYAAPTTTVNLNDTVLTNPITRVYVVATRDGLWPFGMGYVVARDYGTDRAALEAADAAAAAAGKELRITHAYTIDDDVTLAASKITVQPGVPFAISTTKTLTINGSLEAGLYQIFSCTGTGKAVFARNKVKEIIPQWWGAKGDDSTDDTAAMQAFLTCCEQSWVPGFIPPGTYQVGPLKAGDPATGPVGTAQGPGAPQLRGPGKGYAIAVLKAKAGQYGSNQYVLQRNNMAGIHYGGFGINGNSIAKGLDLSWNVSGPSNQNILEDILIENCLNLGANLDNFMDSRTSSLQIRGTIGDNPVDLTHQSSGGSWEMNSCYFTGLIQLQSQNGTLINCAPYGGIELTLASVGQICMVGGQIYKNPITNICVNSGGTGDTSQGMTFVNVQFNDGTIFSGKYFMGARLIGCNIGATTAGAFAADITPLGGAGNLPVFKLEHCTVNAAQTFDTALAHYIMDNCRGTAGAVRTSSNYVISKTTPLTSDLVTIPNSFKIAGRNGETFPIGNGFLLGSDVYALGNQSPAAIGTVLSSPAADTWIDIGTGVDAARTHLGAWFVTISSTDGSGVAMFSLIKYNTDAGTATKMYAVPDDGRILMQWAAGVAQPQVKFVTTAPTTAYIGIFGSGLIN